MDKGENRKMKITKILKRTAPVFAFAILFASIASGSVFAWGPERTTFTMNKPATYPTFNSITDNNEVGDERNFVRIIENGTNGSYKDSVKVVPGKEYKVAVFFHNNAAANYNASGKGIATGVKLAAQFSNAITAGQRGNVTAVISADNTNPKQVWDEAYMTSDQNVTMTYKPGSARIYNDHGLNGQAVSDDVITKQGTFLGVNSFDGRVEGCEEYHGRVTFILVAQKDGISIDKTVSKDGQKYSDSVSANPGEEVYYRLVLKNTGNTQLNNVTVWDTLPDGISLVPGSTSYTAAGNTVGLGDTIHTTGYKFDTFPAGQTIVINFKAKISDKYNDKVKCGTHKLTNVAHVAYDGGPNSSKCKCSCKSGGSASVEGSCKDVYENGSNKDGSNCADGVGNSFCGGDETDQAVVTIKKNCSDACTENPDSEECKTLVEDCTENPNQEKCEAIVADCTENPNQEKCRTLAAVMPKSGPAEIAVGIIAGLALISGIGYWIYSRRSLKRTMNGVKNGPKGGNTPITPANS